MKRTGLIFIVLSLLVASFSLPPDLFAQDGDDVQPTPATPETHVVQDGETLTSIAALYDASVADLLLVNGLDADDLIFPGQSLFIPGAEGTAIPTTYVVQAGDSLTSVARRFHTSPAAIASANRLVSDSSLYAGQSIAVLSETGLPEPQPITGTLHFVQPGETLLMLAARYALTPTAIAAANDLSFPIRLYPGMRVRLPSGSEYQELPGGWQRLTVRPVPITQGQTVSIYVEYAQPGEPAGHFAGQELRFAPWGAGYVALAGVDAFAEPGRHDLSLQGSDESWWPLHEEVAVVAGSYPTQTINVAAELEPLLAPEVRAEEDAFLHDIYTQFTPEPLWEGLFQVPVTTTIVTAGYGGARSYNGGPFSIFHTGVDFAGTTGTPILAPATGTVVFSDTLQLRGDSIMIDHGLGVFTAYNHLSEVYVNVGDQVIPGQRIALGGSTGLSTGPHLHWELRVMDVPVDAMQWTREYFP
ncbi:MAG: LysM peptidoglycan-binding domain-containing protein [Anaerolineae bacterium]|nr:LysM peptidoglycan-binding domain-containing protein [Anaerolineae bacterium]